MHTSNNDVIYFDSFRVEHVPKEIKKFIGSKNINKNIFRIQAHESTMYRYNFVLDLFMLFLQVKICLNILAGFYFMILKKYMFGLF